MVEEERSADVLSRNFIKELKKGSVYYILPSLTYAYSGLFLCRYIRPQFFFNNPLLSFIQYVIGPYTDDLGNVLPYAVEGVGVPCDPLAFAGLLG